MSKGTNRRKRRQGGSWLPLLLVLVLFAGGLGYGITKYVIYPYVLNEEASIHFLDFQPGNQSPVSGSGDSVQSGADLQSPGADNTNTQGGSPAVNASNSGTQTDSPTFKPVNPGTTDGSEVRPDTDSPTSGNTTSMYAVQLGSYSTYEGAQEAARDLKSQGIDTYIVEKEGSFKVVGSPHADRLDAERALAALSPEGEEGYFITTMEVLTQ